MAEQSPTFKDLWMLDGVQDFNDYSIKLTNRARRHIAVVTHDLDALVYENAHFISSISKFARSNRYAQIQLLIKNTKPAIDRGHQLIRLAQRLSSKISVRKMTIEPEKKEVGFMLFDTDGLLYKNDESTYRGFANFAALHEVKELREQFDYLWQYGEAEPGFQILYI